MQSDIHSVFNKSLDKFYNKNQNFTDLQTETSPIFSDINNALQNQTQSNATHRNSTQPKETQSNQTQSNVTQINSTQPKETQSNQTQSNTTQLNSTQPKATQSNQTQSNATQLNLSQSKSTQLNPTQNNASTSNKTQLNSTQYKTTQPQDTLKVFPYNQIKYKNIGLFKNRPTKKLSCSFFH